MRVALKFVVLDAQADALILAGLIVAVVLELVMVCAKLNVLVAQMFVLDAEMNAFPIVKTLVKVVIQDAPMVAQINAMDREDKEKMKNG